MNLARGTEIECDREGTQTQTSCYLPQCSDNYPPACLVMICRKEPPVWLVIICLNFLGLVVFEIDVP